jgi:hypothetical protein
LPVGSLLPERRSHELLDRSDEIVQSVADVTNERHFGEHDIAHAGIVDAHVDEFRPARHDRRCTIVLQFVADVDNDIGAFRIAE